MTTSAPRRDVSDVNPEEPLRADVRSRIAWLDVAKALAIVSVVGYHVSLTGAAYLVPDTTDAWTEFWRDTSLRLLPVRMPLFFLVSGVLAQSALRRPWSLLWRRRVGNLLWPFALWSVLFGVVYAYGYWYERANPWDTMRQQWLAIPLGGTAYWYLSLLVIFFVIARLARAHPGVVLTVALVGWLGSGLATRLLADALPPDAVTNLGRLTSLGIWFFVGCYAGPVVLAVAASRSWPTLVVAGGLYAVIAYRVYGDGLPGGQWPFALNVLGVLAAILVSAWLAQSEHVVRLSRVIAPRTLAIYVVHPVVLNLLVILTRRGDGSTGVPVSSPVVGLLFTPLVTAALVTAAIGLNRLAERVGADWLFTLPPARRLPAPPPTETDGAAETDGAQGPDNPR